MILVIEDEPAIRANILRILSFKGFDTIAAVDGAEGVRLATLHAPNLIICDIMMPNLNGYEVLAQLRQDPDTAMIPFIFLTAKVDRAEMRQGMNLGADDYLTKPFSTSELLEAVTARLEKQATITQPFVDEMKRAAESLSRVAYTDPLTNLPNRIFLRHRLQEVLRQADTSIVAVLCLNLDRFSTVNVDLGASAGDLLLQAVADRLARCLGPKDLAARLSGDEFGVLMVAADTSQVVAQVQTLLNTLTQPYTFDDRIVQTRLSIGVAVYPENSTSADKLMTQAELARRTCRDQGGNSYLFFADEIGATVAEQRALEADLAMALERSEFLLHYQPQVNLVTGRIIGVEALLRWQHPTRGLVAPPLFIPIAERTGWIGAIGEWVLRTACTQIAALQSLSIVPLRLSVNVSARQFQQHNLPDMVTRVLEETGFKPEQLTLELTETALMDDVGAAIAAIEALKAMQISISIDDFGTGYSSLNYLHELPIDILKIDKSFVALVTESDRDATITTAIIGLAQSLKLKVIAEGVETEAQLAFLRQQGCYLMQGYLYSPAVPIDAIKTLLIDDKRLGSAAKPAM